MLSGIGNSLWFVFTPVGAYIFFSREFFLLNAPIS